MSMEVSDRALTSKALKRVVHFTFDNSQVA